MKLKFASFLLAVMLAGCEGCNDDPKPLSELEKLPPATQVGKNTFGCLVEGKAWVTGTSVDVTAFYQEGVLSINATNDNNSESIYIAIYDEDLMEKEYQLPQENVDNITSTAGLNEFKTTKCRFETTSDYPGKVSIANLDQREGVWIISGTFEFQGHSADCLKSISVSNGRFDVNYAP